jgi:isobutyryl-CoA mutase
MSENRVGGATARQVTRAQVEEGPLRFVSAASLFDGHDAAINIIRRLLQSHGAEVVHLGHNRSVADIVRAAIQEDADGIACSSYQGGHNEYFRYMVDMLREQGAEHIRIVVGGGGTIAPHEVTELEAYGVERIYTPEDGRRLGLEGMINDVFTRVRKGRKPAFEFGPVGPRDHKQIARTISVLEQDEADAALGETLRRAVARSTRKPPVIGITGTGGAGKSSLTDELLMRFVRHFPERNVAVVAMDPTRRRSGGALLGDRIRMNSLAAEQVFMRSLATRRAHLATSAVLADVLNLLKYAGFDLVVIETAGIGQSDSEIVDLVDVPMYVMTSEYGAASQLEKIDMLDFAEIIALNKFEKRGAEDALRDVRKQWRRNRVAFTAPDDQVPVYPTIASRFNDPGVNKLFAALCTRLDAKTGETGAWHVADPGPTELVERHALVPAQRARYLAEIAGNGRRAGEEAQHRATAASRAQSLYEALRTLDDRQLPAALERYPAAALGDAESEAAIIRLRGAYNDALDAVGIEGIALLRQWPAQAKSATDDQYVYSVRGREIRGDNYVGTLSHNKVPKLAVPTVRRLG